MVLPTVLYLSIMISFIRQSPSPFNSKNNMLFLGVQKTCKFDIWPLNSCYTTELSSHYAINNVRLCHNISHDCKVCKKPKPLIQYINSLIYHMKAYCITALQLGWTDMQTQKHTVLGKPIGINQACTHIASQSECTPGLKMKEISRDACVMPLYYGLQH